MEIPITKITKDYKSFSLNKQVINEALNSLGCAYKYLIDNLIPSMFNEVFEAVGLTNFKISKRVNLDGSNCLSYEKSQVYQWYLSTQNFLGKSVKVKFLEIPVVNNWGVSIVNGYKKIFVIKLKRRNFHFRNYGKTFETYLTNLRNKTVKIVCCGEGDRSPFLFFYETHRTVDVFVYLKEIYGKKAVENVIDSLPSNAVKSKITEWFKDSPDSDNSNQLKNEEITVFRLLSTDLRLLHSIVPEVDPSNLNVLSPEILVRLLYKVIDNRELHEFIENSFINQSWLTVGGYLRDLIERALFGNRMKELGAYETAKELLEKLDSILNLNDLRNKISSYCTDGSFTHMLEDSNPLSEIYNGRKVSLLFKGLINRLSATMDSRDIFLYMQGRLCPISTTEGQTIGLIRHLSLCAKFNEHEDLLVPYFKVKNGTIATSKVHWLKEFDERYKVMTDAKSMGSDFKIIKARRNNQLLLVKREAVDYVGCIPGQSIGLSINMLPRSNCSEPDRMLMAGNMSRQSLILKRTSPMKIKTVSNDVTVNLYLENVNEGLFLDNDVLKYVSSKGAVIERDGTFLYKSIDFLRKSNNKNALISKLNSSAKIVYNKKVDSQLFSIHSIVNDRWSLGNSLRCAYMMWDGYSFEDSIVVSDRVVKEELLSSLHVEDIVIPIFKTAYGDEKITRKVLNPFKYDMSSLNEDGVVKVGSMVRGGDILVSKVCPVRKKENTPEQRLLSAILGEGTLNVRNSFGRLPINVKHGVVTAVDYQRGRMSTKDFSYWSDIKKREFEDQKNEILINLANKISKTLQEGKKLAARWIDGEVDARISPIVDHFESLKHGVKQSVSRKDCLYCVKVTVIVDKPIQIGDKLTGLHGNKGVISKIVPASDMPFDENGRSIDIVISSISVYGRLNYSQMLESKLTAINTSYRNWISELSKVHNLSDNVRNSIEETLNPLSEFTGVPVENLLRNEQIIFLDQPYQDIDESLINELSLLSSFEENVSLRCGKKGVKFDKPVHVGELYFLKLIHTVESKFSARSIGSNSIKFNQPTRGQVNIEQSRIIGEGKAQKIGTMEKDAIIGRGLPFFLHELFTIRSDSISLRRRILTGEFLNIDWESSWNLTESTKVLFNYLKCLGFNFELNKTDNKLRQVRCRLMSNEEVKELSRGEVNVADTYHYRTKKGVKGGLFCAKIFGGDHDFSCECSKYVGRRYKGMECSQCGVLVTSNHIRRNFFGHVKLVSPALNFKLIQDKLVRRIIDCPSLNQIIARKNYIVIKSDGSYDVTKAWINLPINSKSQILSGAEAVQYLIRKVDVHNVLRKSRVNYLRRKNDDSSSAYFEDYVQIRQWVNSGNRLDNVIINNLLVMPKGLRPLMFTGSGSYITTNINALYLQVIRRNNRLKELMRYNLIPFVIDNMKGMLQESVNALLWKSTEIDQLYTSISDQIKGKQGICRQHVLSKRVNFSGRSTLVLDPKIDIGFCRLPKDMLIKIALPLIQDKLVMKNVADDFYDAFEKIKNGYDVTDIINEICLERPVLLNRNPTLHTLSMQSFFCIPSDDMGIGLHPLTCKALGADFDGDTASVYMPLSNEATEELLTKVYDHSAINPSNYELVIKPTREIAVGLYFFTANADNIKSIPNVHPHMIGSLMELHHPNTRIELTLNGRSYSTNLGRAILMMEWQKYREGQATVTELNSINKVMDNTNLTSFCSFINPTLMKNVWINEFCDFLKKIGNDWATYSGFSFSIKELQDGKVDYDWDSYYVKLYKVQEHLKLGLIDENDFENEIVKVWQNVEEILNERIKLNMRGTNHELLIKSNFRGSWENILGLNSARGLVTLRRSFIYPVSSNLHDGYNEMDFITLSTIMRKLITKSLGTAKGGYFNRQIVELLRECLVVEHDCGTDKGLKMSLENEKDRIHAVGRVLNEDVTELSLTSGTVIDANVIEEISRVTSEVNLRSPIFCKTARGVCQKCFGWKPGSADFFGIGFPVGIVSAHALAEPVTQMLMKTKHFRNLNIYEGRLENLTKSSEAGTLTFSGNVDGFVWKEDLNGWLCLNRLHDDVLYLNGREHQVKYGDVVLKFDGEVNEGEVLIRTLLEETVYASEDSIVNSVTDNEIVLSGEKGQVLRFKIEDELEEFRIGQTVSKGDKLLKVPSFDSLTTVELSSFAILNKLINLRSTYMQDPSFSIFAPFDGKVSFNQNNKVDLVPSNPNYTKVTLPESLYKHRFVTFIDREFIKGDIVYFGEERKHALDMIRDGEYVQLAEYYVKEISEIYFTEKISIQRVHIEMFIKELLFLGFSDTLESSYPKPARNLSYYIERDQPYKNIIRKNISDAFADQTSPLSIITYEDIVRNVILLSVIGATDALHSINANIIMNRVMPIESNFRFDLWKKIYDNLPPNN